MFLDIFHVLQTLNPETLTPKIRNPKPYVPVFLTISLYIHRYSVLVSFLSHYPYITSLYSLISYAIPKP